MLNAKYLLSKAKFVNNLLYFGELYSAKDIRKIMNDLGIKMNSKLFNEVLVVARTYDVIYHDKSVAIHYIYWRK